MPKRALDDDPYYKEEEDDDYEPSDEDVEDRIAPHRRTTAFSLRKGAKRVKAPTFSAAAFAMRPDIPGLETAQGVAITAAREEVTAESKELDDLWASLKGDDSGASRSLGALQRPRAAAAPAPAPARAPVAPAVPAAAVAAPVPSSAASTDVAAPTPAAADKFDDGLDDIWAEMTGGRSSTSLGTLSRALAGKPAAAATTMAVPVRPPVMLASASSSTVHTTPASLAPNTGLSNTQPAAPASSSSSSSSSVVQNTTTPSSGSTPENASAVSSAAAPMPADLELADDEVELKEEVEFAGKSMLVTRRVKKGSKEEARILKRQAALSTKKSNISSILARLDPKKKLSTLEKSRLDWERSKKETGDAHELEQYTKDGYLTKQAFLLEVDHRTFQLEKADRNKQRAQRE